MLRPAETAKTEEWLSSAGVPCSTIINMADGVLYIAGLSRIVERDMKRMYEVVRSCSSVYEETSDP